MMANSWGAVDEAARAREAHIAQQLHMVEVVFQLELGQLAIRLQQEQQRPITTLEPVGALHTFVEPGGKDIPLAGNAPAGSGAASPVPRLGALPGPRPSQLEEIEEVDAQQEPKQSQPDPTAASASRIRNRTNVTVMNV